MQSEVLKILDENERRRVQEYYDACYKLNDLLKVLLKLRAIERIMLQPFF